MAMKITVVVGNPKPRSRTWDAAHRIAFGIAGNAGAEITSFDLADFGAKLLDWSDADVETAVEQLRQADVVVVASPTFKATYTGLLKLFLDRIEGGTGLESVVAVPLQLGAAPQHQLSPELHLKPVLVELGAIVPSPALYLIDKEPGSAAELAWLERWAPLVRSLGLTLGGVRA